MSIILMSGCFFLIAFPYLFAAPGATHGAGFISLRHVLDIFPDPALFFPRCRHRHLRLPCTEEFGSGFESVGLSDDRDASRAG